MNSKPDIKDLHRHVSPIHAPQWREIGVELGLLPKKLNVIKADYIQHGVRRCCNEMFEEWLKVDVTASWKKLLDALESPAVQTLRSNAGKLILQLVNI